MNIDRVRLGVNIDHVATVRNARGGGHPDPIRAGQLAWQAGADGITIHLREDRRHILDDDLNRLIETVDLPLNLEMASTEEMLKIALKTKPTAVCLVPEKRSELTTEGGLDISVGGDRLQAVVNQLKAVDIRVAAFIDPDENQVVSASTLGFDAVELHTGTYCNAEGGLRKTELSRLLSAAKMTEDCGLSCHAGHGLAFNNISDIAQIPEIVEFNIGHFLIGESIFIGLSNAIKKMRVLIDEARRDNKSNRGIDN